MRLVIRKMVGHISRMFSPGYSYCGRCRRPWNVCSGHVIYDSDGSGCFALCEECWGELSPIERVPYYKKVVDSWKTYGSDTLNGIPFEELWNNLEENILAGK